jgi:hypothetical protein
VAKSERKSRKTSDNKGQIEKSLARLTTSTRMKESLLNGSFHARERLLSAILAQAELFGSHRKTKHGLKRLDLRDIVLSGPIALAWTSLKRFLNLT